MESTGLTKGKVSRDIQKKKTQFLHWEKLESWARVLACVGVRKTEHEREISWESGSGEMVLRNGGGVAKCLFFFSYPFLHPINHWKACASQYPCLSRPLSFTDRPIVLHLLPSSVVSDSRSTEVERNNHIAAAQLVWSAQDPGILHHWALALETHVSLEGNRPPALHMGCLVQ